MTGKQRKMMQILLILVFLVSTALLVRQFFDNAGGTESYDAALAVAMGGKSRTSASAPTEAVSEEAAGQPQWIPAHIEEEDPHLETLAAIDLAALREVNPDVIGWILIPDTKVNYPILQGQDNDFYLNHTWDQQENSVGSIFMEWRNTSDFTDFNTIVYGHNMNDGSMFANVRRYSAQWYWENHPYIYIVTDGGIYRYEIFSSYKAPTDSAAYGLSFQQNTTKVNFLTEAVKNSEIYTAISPELTDRILTLSTCSGTGYTNRWVVHARLKMIRAE